MGQDAGTVGQFFQQEKMWEKHIATKILSNMRAVWSMRKDRDRQLDGLLNKIPPPPELVQAKVWLRYRMAMARSRELKRVIAYILKFVIKPLLDMFQPDPIMMSSYWKDGPTSPGERGVIVAPGKMTGSSRDYEEEFLQEESILEDIGDFEGVQAPGSDEYDSTNFGFTGPAGDKAEDISEEDEER